MKAAGYIRVSNTTQNQALQEEAIQRWAEANDAQLTWYRDKWSGKSMERPGWEKLEKAYRAGRAKVIVCWKLDRLGRTCAGLATLFEELRARKVQLISLTDGFDLASPSGRLHAQIIASVAEYETEVRGERVRAGIAVAKAKGTKFGRAAWKGPKRKTDIAEVKRLRAEGVPVKAIAKQYGVTPQAIYRLL